VACGEWAANVDTDKLHLPLDGSMFYSPRPQNGFPPPFELDATRRFGEMLCPVCHSNFTEEDAVMTKEGRFEVKPLPEGKGVPIEGGGDAMTPSSGAGKTAPSSALWTCDECGKPCKSNAGLIAHKRVVH
jgi:hypothetical protein